MVMSDLPNGKALAKAYIADQEGYYAVNQRVCALTPSDAISSPYLFYILNRNRYFLKFDNGVSQTHLLNNAFAKCPVALPPTKAEQEAIAKALSDADALIESLEQLIAKKRQIKQGAMQELLTEKKRLPGFSGEWESKRVDEFGDIVTGGTPSTSMPDFWHGEYPWVTPTDISLERDMFTTERMVTPLGLAAVRRLPPNSVLVTCIASIGKNAILRSVGASNQQINAIIPAQDCDSEFLYYLFEFNTEKLLANAGTTATSIISKATFSEIDFLVPTLPEQTAIAEILSDMDAEIVALEGKLSKARQVKQGMMQELLTGNIRLVEPEAATPSATADE